MSNPPLNQYVPAPSDRRSVKNPLHMYYMKPRPRSRDSNRSTRPPLPHVPSLRPLPLMLRPRGAVLLAPATVFASLRSAKGLCTSLSMQGICMPMPTGGPC
eukprot:scaffold219383_cov27-Tisochrysis_lutea.AAC.3